LWLEIKRLQVRFLVLPDFLRNTGSETAPFNLMEVNEMIERKIATAV
jgi:hypothetical protein